MDTIIGMFRTLLEGVVVNLSDAAALYLPRLTLGLALIVVGWALGRLLDFSTRSLLRRLGLDALAERLRLASAFRNAGIQRATSAIAGRLVFGLTVLVFTLAAIEALGLEALTASLERLVAYLPSLIAAAFLLVIGLSVAQIARNLVRSTATAGRLEQADRLGTVTHRLVVVLFLLVAADQLGLQADVLVGLLALAIGVLAVSFGAAFALGAAPVAKHILAGHFLRKSLQVGNAVTVQGRRGTVQAVGPTDTLFASEEGTWTVPNGLLIEEVAIR